MLGSILLTVAVVAQSIVATPIKARTAYAVRETHNVPRRWTKASRAEPKQMLSLQIGVKQSNFAELERHLYEGMHAHDSGSNFW